MKLLVLVLTLLSLSSAETVSPQCVELNKKAMERLDQMDKALKLKTGFLLGEMEGAKQALQGCLDYNKGAETRASLLWFLTEGGLLLLGILLWIHHRRMKKAVLVLNSHLHEVRPAHSVSYLPSQWIFRILMFTLAATFSLTNLVALFL